MARLTTVLSPGSLQAADELPGLDDQAGLLPQLAHRRLQHLAEPVEILDGKRPVEAVGLAHHLDVLGARTVAGEGDRREAERRRGRGDLGGGPARPGLIPAPGQAPWRGGMIPS